MSTSIKTTFGPVVMFERANQEGPYRLYKKKFKFKKDKILLAELEEIIKRYYSDYTNKDVEKLYSKLSSSGCTYATMANAIMKQFNNDVNSFKLYFGEHLCNSDGSINHNKLMLDIFACIANMVELKIIKYKTCIFNNYIEAAKDILGIDTINTTEALNNLNNAGWLGNGIDENGKLIFINKRYPEIEIYRDTPRNLANKLFGIDDDSMDVDKLELFLKNTDTEYSLEYLEANSKFSGLVISANNIKKWMQIYFERNNIDLNLEAFSINRKDLLMGNFNLLITSLLEQGYSINVSPSVGSNVTMTDGSIFGWGDIKNHAMNFEGFDPNGNILVCSWGENHMIPKEYYNQLDFICIKLMDNVKEFKKSI